VRLGRLEDYGYGFLVNPKTEEDIRRFPEQTIQNLLETPATKKFLPRTPLAQSKVLKKSAFICEICG